jgi:N-acetylmuramoyl-L-alanine amidase
MKLIHSVIMGLTLIVPAMGLAQTVCIDPGHPSEVGKGTRGKKISEIHAAWKVAILLKKELESSGITVVMTKGNETQYVKNRDRAATANKVKSNLMVRLHCDSEAGSGFAVYTPQKKGTAQGKTGPARSVLDACKNIGPIFHDELVAGLKGKLKDNGLLPDTATAVGGKYGALIGSIFSEVPVVLIEMCRLSNKKDEAFISSVVGQKTMAHALAQATLKVVNFNK